MKGFIMSKLKKPILLITYGLVLFFVLLNFGVLVGFTRQIFSLVSPFLWGFALAYLLNIPYKYILTQLFKAKPQDKGYSRKKALAILLSYCLFLLIIILSFSILIPQLVASINEFIGNFSGYYSSFETLFSNILQKLQLQTTFWSEVQNAIMAYQKQIVSLVNNILPSLINLATGAASGIFNMIFTLILSAYFLASKDKLSKLVKRSIHALTSKQTIIHLNHILVTTNETFKGFIVGQLTDALIVGLITFIGSSLLGFPYPMLVGFIAGLTNIIPVLGPFIGAVPCFFIILMAAPDKAFWYLVFVVVLQQIDGNFICPKIVGDSIGLDGIWVIFAVIAGGGLFGIIGSFLCVPVFATLFKLYDEWIDYRLQHKEPKVATPHPENS